MAYTLDTKVNELLKDSHAVEVLEKHIPGISKEPVVRMVSEMTLKSLLAMPQAQQYGVTEEKALSIIEEINAGK